MDDAELLLRQILSMSGFDEADFDRVSISSPHLQSDAFLSDGRYYIRLCGEHLTFMDSEQKDTVSISHPVVAATLMGGMAMCPGLEKAGRVSLLLGSQRMASLSDEIRRASEPVQAQR